MIPLASTARTPLYAVPDSVDPDFVRDVYVKQNLLQNRSIYYLYYISSILFGNQNIISTGKCHSSGGL